MAKVAPPHDHVGGIEFGIGQPRVGIAQSAPGDLVAGLPAKATIVLLHFDVGEAGLKRVLALDPAQTIVKRIDVRGIVALTPVPISIAQTPNIQTREDRTRPRPRHALKP